MAGRTLYWPKDAAWWRRGRIVKLGREFGPTGPAVIDHLMCDARTQGPIKGHDGSVRSDFASLSMLCFVGDDALVAEIVARATELGLLDDFEDFGGGMFECRMSGWLQDVERPLAAERKRSQRGAPSPPKTPVVPECPPKSPEVTREVEVEGERDNPPLNPPQGETKSGDDLFGTAFPQRPVSGRTRDKDRYDELVNEWLRAHVEVVGHLDRTTFMHGVGLCVGAPATAENVVAALERWESSLENAA